MSVIICPGVHPPELTQDFLEGIGKLLNLKEVYVFPTRQFPAYSALHILKFLSVQPSAQSSQLQHCTLHPLLLIGFSAGVVGAIGAAQILQTLGVQVKAVIAFDGWGVPLLGNFPIHRISHDRFTDWSSTLWGRSDSSFYADPAVTHLELWRSPQTISGWTHEAIDAASAARLSGYGQKQYSTTAAQFLKHLLIHYQEAEAASIT
ncbi:MAG: hypothetical protein KME11_09240 [Timaviella obliquedivisa GSE-PSE-MK23-08B]|nr:hypothetical protein [Timaviella obliquedivisa GSE-PSE-MK23-08B]